MHYEAMAQDALRGVVRSALRRAALGVLRHGLVMHQVLGRFVLGHEARFPASTEGNLAP
jgi:hypothetical protein